MFGSSETITSYFKKMKNLSNSEENVPSSRSDENKKKFEAPEKNTNFDQGKTKFSLIDKNCCSFESKLNVLTSESNYTTHDELMDQICSREVNIERTGPLPDFCQKNALISVNVDQSSGNLQKCDSFEMKLNKFLTPQLDTSKCSTFDELMNQILSPYFYGTQSGNNTQNNTTVGESVEYLPLAKDKNTLNLQRKIANESIEPDMTKSKSKPSNFDLHLTQYFSLLRKRESEKESNKLDFQSKLGNEREQKRIASTENNDSSFIDPTNNIKQEPSNFDLLRERVSEKNLSQESDTGKGKSPEYFSQSPVLKRRKLWDSVPSFESVALNSRENDSQNWSQTIDLMEQEIHDLNPTPSFRDVGTQTSEEVITEYIPKHPLKILSQDITTLPNGCKIFNNIPKIGTDKWLKSAMHWIRHGNFGWKPTYGKIFEDSNSYQMYVDYSLEMHLLRSMDDETKVCEIISETVKLENLDTAFASPYFSCKNFQNSISNLQRQIDKICQRKDLRGAEYAPRAIDKEKIQNKIHNIFANIFEVFEEEKLPILVMKPTIHCVMKDGKLVPNEGAQPRQITAKNVTFCRLLFLLARVYSLLQSKSKITQRELYYQVKTVFEYSSTLCVTLQNVSSLLGIGPWNLNIVSHSGLVYGNLVIKWASGETLYCNTRATSIPFNVDEIVEVRTDAFFILVVEKESVFQKLLEEGLPNKVPRPFILLTGKGMPSVNDRLFLNKISRLMALPVLILVDVDVYGIKIMLTYRFGSMKNCQFADDLACPHARWLGVFPSEIQKYGLTTQKTQKRHKRLVEILLNSRYLDEHPKIRAEVEVLQNLNQRASIENMIKSDTFLSGSYLTSKFLNEDFI